jgi:hypothetical protein
MPITFKISLRMNHEGIKGVNGMCMIKLYNALDGPRNIKSPIGFVIDLGEGMSYNVARPPTIVPRWKPHIKTIISNGRLSPIFMNTTT